MLPKYWTDKNEQEWVEIPPDATRDDGIKFYRLFVDGIATSRYKQVYPNFSATSGRGITLVWDNETTDATSF